MSLEQALAVIAWYGRFAGRNDTEEKAYKVALYIVEHAAKAQIK